MYCMTQYVQTLETFAYHSYSEKTAVAATTLFRTPVSDLKN
jgi:hypothetical protein